MLEKLKFNPKEIGPIEQGLIILCLMIMMSAVFFITRVTNIYVWNILLVFLLMYCVYNAVFAIFTKQLPKYLGLSILVFSMLCLVVYVSGNLIADVKYKDARELRIITILLPVFYAMFYFSCLIFRFVLEFLYELDK